MGVALTKKSLSSKAHKYILKYLAPLSEIQNIIEAQAQKEQESKNLSTHAGLTFQKHETNPKYLYIQLNGFNPDESNWNVPQKNQTRDPRYTNDAKIETTKNTTSDIFSIF